MKSKIIYIELLEEGTICFVPVEAVEKGVNTFLIPKSTIVPTDEVWAYKPGETVICKNNTFSDGKEGLLAYDYA